MILILRSGGARPRVWRVRQYTSMKRSRRRDSGLDTDLRWSFEEAAFAWLDFLPRGERHSLIFVVLGGKWVAYNWRLG